METVVTMAMDNVMAAYMANCTGYLDSRIIAVCKTKQRLEMVVKRVVDCLRYGLGYEQDCNQGQHNACVGGDLHWSYTAQIVAKHKTKQNGHGDG